MLPFPAAALLSSGFMNDTVLHSQINASAENHTAPTAGVTVHTFENGLQLIVREDHSAPVVSAQAWCRAGSIDEGDWIGAGLSHVLEHMLFKGTTTRGAGRIDQEVQAAGGYMNAYTSFDRTVYWINVPVSGGRVAIDILCDIFQHATLPADELVKELDVIRREMDMCNDDPGRRSSRRLFEVAFIRSPYRYPIIGIPDIFNRLSRDQIAAYYTEKYAPNNCFLVVAGDVNPPDVIAQVEASFAKSQARPVPVSVVPAEPSQTSGREVIEEAPVELGHFHFAWHIGDLRHRDVDTTRVGEASVPRFHVCAAGTARDQEPSRERTRCDCDARVGPPRDLDRDRQPRRGSTRAHLPAMGRVCRAAQGRCGAERCEPRRTHARSCRRAGPQTHRVVDPRQHPRRIRGWLRERRAARDERASQVAGELRSVRRAGRDA